MNRCLNLTAIAALCVCGTALADEDVLQPLHIGDPAPNLDVAHWLTGDAVTKFESGRVYVVEFWATWCPPCRKSMPHITEMQKKYRDYNVSIIGISDEPLQTVVGFYAKGDQKDDMGYTVTTDPDRSTYTSYMQGVGATGIPTAFIIGKDGRLEWSGHPMDLDEPLDSIVKDSWDRKSFAEEFEPKAEKKRAMVRDRMILRNAYKNGDWEFVLEHLNSQIKENGDDPSLKLEKFKVMAMLNHKETYEFARDLMKQFNDDSYLLNALAWMTVDEKDFKDRDLEFALDAAKRANDLTGGEDAMILDTLARVYFDLNRMDEAVKYQRKAVKFAENEMKEDLEKTLEKYEDESNNN